ncbi:MAG: hypothetical protein KY444_03495 [Gemmatimonadetes bacterium]|nr:hypothetical protein [Gemmatimonadota bacterium]
MRLLPLGFALLVAGCGSIFGSDGKRVIGVIGDGSGIEVPATVQAGQDFTVTIQTSWPNGCAHEDGTEVQQGAASATVTPYDHVSEGGTCTHAPQRFTHVATLRFSQPGTAVVKIRGRPSPNEGAQTIQRIVTVQ